MELKIVPAECKIAMGALAIGAVGMICGLVVGFSEFVVEEEQTLLWACWYSSIILGFVAIVGAAVSLFVEKQWPASVIGLVVGVASVLSAEDWIFVAVAGTFAVLYLFFPSVVDFFLHGD